MPNDAEDWEAVKSALCDQVPTPSPEDLPKVRMVEHAGDAAARFAEALKRDGQRHWDLFELACKRIAKLESALRECSGDLRAEVTARYGEDLPPALRRKFDRDMEPVLTADKLLGKPRQGGSGA